MAKIALIGASGRVGSRILNELLDRGHQVTAIARSTEKIIQRPGVHAVEGNANDRQELSRLIEGHDAVISAVPFSSSDPDALVDAVRASGVNRYLVVGGAGSLMVGNTRLIDTPDFPDAYRPEASAGAVFLAKLKNVHDLDWIFLSPSAEFEPGKRTGAFRLGLDDLLVTETGSSISFEDYAVALVDELEEPAHHRARFTVGY